MAKIQRSEINKLVDKYGTAVPRYTSYPTAPEWQDEFSQVKFEAAIAKSNQVNQIKQELFPFSSTLLTYWSSLHCVVQI